MKEQEHDVSRHPYPEVKAMIAQTFADVFSPQWVETHSIDPAHDLVILCHIIPWQPIIAVICAIGCASVQLPAGSGSSSGHSRQRTTPGVTS